MCNSRQFRMWMYKLCYVPKVLLFLVLAMGIIVFLHTASVLQAASINIIQSVNALKIADNKSTIAPKISQAFQEAMSLDERQLLYRIVSWVTNVCAAKGITCFMYGGTLLGSYRHHDVIPWDDDFDILVSHKERGLLSRSLRYASEDKPEFAFEYAGPRIKIYSKKGSKNSKYLWKWPYVDVSFYKENSTHIYDLSMHSKDYIYPKTVMFPPYKRPMGPLMLDAPQSTLCALKLTYYDVERCKTYFYSHRLERRRTDPTYSVACEDLAGQYSFVRRRRGLEGHGMLETLCRDGEPVKGKVAFLDMSPSQVC